MIIDSTTDAVHVFLSGQVASTQLDVCSAYNTLTTTTIVPGKVQATTDNWVPVNILPPPGASEQNQLRFCSVFNSDTSNATVNVEYSGNSGRSLVFVASIDPGESVQYTHDRGWSTYSSVGQERVVGMNDAPGELRIPPNLKPINITTALTLVSGTDYGYYLGKTDKATSQVKVRFNVTSSPTVITWSEMAIYKSQIKLASGTTVLTFCGFADMSATVNTTGLKTATITVTGVTENTDIFAVIGSVHTGTYAIRAALPDTISTGGFGTVTGSLRPSTNPSLTITTDAATSSPWLNWQGTQW